MTIEELDFIGSMNMCDEISNEAYKKIVCHCEEQQSCDDCISRQAVIYALCDTCELFHKNGEETCLTKCESYHFLATLPPVTPKEKTGHWKSYCYQNNRCSVCGYIIADSDADEYKYCPNCGRKMIEPQESEDKKIENG